MNVHIKYIFKVSYIHYFTHLLKKIRTYEVKNTRGTKPYEIREYIFTKEKYDNIKYLSDKYYDTFFLAN